MIPCEDTQIQSFIHLTRQHLDHIDPKGISATWTEDMLSCMDNIREQINQLEQAWQTAREEKNQPASI